MPRELAPIEGCPITVNDDDSIEFTARFRIDTDGSGSGLGEAVDVFLRGEQKGKRNAAVLLKVIEAGEKQIAGEGHALDPGALLEAFQPLRGVVIKAYAKVAWFVGHESILDAKIYFFNFLLANFANIINNVRMADRSSRTKKAKAAQARKLKLHGDVEGELKARVEAMIGLGVAKPADLVRQGLVRLANDFKATGQLVFLSLD